MNSSRPVRWLRTMIDSLCHNGPYRHGNCVWQYCYFRESGSEAAADAIDKLFTYPLPLFHCFHFWTQHGPLFFWLQTIIIIWVAAIKRNQRHRMIRLITAMCNEQTCSCCWNILGHGHQNWMFTTLFPSILVCLIFASSCEHSRTL